MTFNPWKHLRNAACVVLLVATYLHNWALISLGFMLLFMGIVGGLDLAERRIELLEKILLKEKNDAEA